MYDSERMDPEQIRDTIRREIRQLRERHRALVGDQRGAPTSWEADESTLCWHVVLHEVLEPDIDIELLDEVLIVRARRDSGPDAGSDAGVCEVLLPVPASYRPASPRCVYRSEVLEVRFVVK